MSQNLKITVFTVIKDNGDGSQNAYLYDNKQDWLATIEDFTLGEVTEEDIDADGYKYGEQCGTKEIEIKLAGKLAKPFYFGY